METDNKISQDDYEYLLITVFDQDNIGWDYSIDYLFTDKKKI